MSKKFELKIHDGPGRLGKLNGGLTPTVIDSENFKIADSQSCPYNVEKEIATWCVDETIKLTDESYDIGIIQGGRYLDLRIRSLNLLKEKGFNGFLIGNGDELLLHPRDLVDIIIGLKKQMNVSDYLVFPFCECSFIPLLVYMGVDGFLKDSADYYSYLNVLMTPTKSYDLNSYELYEDMSREDISKYNENSIDFVLREVKAHIKNGTLRNLVEERSTTSPQNISALRIFDKNHKDYILENTQLY